jgi:hypothetical protein
MPEAVYQLGLAIDRAENPPFLFLPDEEEACSAALAVAACSLTAAMNALIFVWTAGKSNVIYMLV